MQFYYYSVKVPLNAILKVYYNRFTCIQGKSMIIYIAASAHFLQCLKLFEKRFPSDWSDGSVCCDWLTAYGMCRK